MKPTTLSTVILALTTGALSQVQRQPFRRSQIDSFVTFGDSYTDIVSISDGGTPWPVYVADFASIKLLPYAKSGATCSNNITFRPFPPVFESQIPAFLSDKQSGAIKVSGQNTLYSLWIGTNDVGVSSLLTGGNSASIVDVAGCMVNWVQTMYDNGARNFLFQNMIPLETVPLYAADSWPNKFWHFQRNTTEWSVMMRELVLSGNALTKLMLQNLASKLHGANIGLFDSHGLFADIFAHPATYLNGTAPLNVTGAVKTCIFQVGNSNENVCTLVNGTDRDSFLWFDELHPSEQADRIVAREIANIIEAKGSKWVTWLD